MMTRRGKLSGIMLALAAFALIPLAALKAVAVSPVALYIDSRERSGVLTLYNDGTRPEEIQIDFAFGYPKSDSTGQISVDLQAEAPAGEPSAVGMATAFPRRMILQPGQRQAVRVLVEPRAGLAEGEYWARVLIKSKGGQPPIEQRRPDGVIVQLDIETVVAIPLSYRNGAVNTGIEITNATAQTRADSVFFTADLARTGNAAWLGRMHAELIDASGTVLARIDENLGVYQKLRRVHGFATPAGARDLRVRLRLDSRRDDLPENGPLPAPEVTRIIPVTS